MYIYSIYVILHCFSGSTTSVITFLICPHLIETCMRLYLVFDGGVVAKVDGVVHWRCEYAHPIWSAALTLVVPGHGDPVPRCWQDRRGHRDANRPCMPVCNSYQLLRLQYLGTVKLGVVRPCMRHAEVGPRPTTRRYWYRSNIPSHLAVTPPLCSKSLKVGW